MAAPGSGAGSAAKAPGHEKLVVTVGHASTSTMEVYATPSLRHRMYMPHEAEPGEADVAASPLALDGIEAKTIPLVAGSGSAASGGSAASAGGSHSSPLHKPLPFSQVASFSVGHVLNDAAAACWFSYLLLYLEKAQGLSGTEAGAVLLAGQLADAAATPTVGIMSDASRGCPRFGLGRRKVWNLGGVIVVAVCFLFVFGLCLACELTPEGEETSTTVKAAVFGLFAALFNVGWAAVQVSHMALVPELSAQEGERVMLNSARYAFTVLSNLAVFLIMLGLLALSGKGDAAYEDSSVYTRLTLAVLGMGGICSLVFLVGTKEKVAGGQGGRGARRSSAASSSSSGGGEGPSRRGSLAASLSPPRGWREWAAEAAFWRVMVVYAAVRMSTNVSQVYLTFFITDSLSMPQEALAVLPLLAYVAQLVAAALTKRISDRLGRRTGLSVAALCVMAACGIMSILQPGAQSVGMYAVVLLLGAGLAVAQVLVVSLESDLIGPHTDTAAFVYGACSFADKLASGVAVMAIQALGDAYYPEGSGGRAGFVRVVNAAVPAGAALVGMITCWFVKLHTPLKHSGAGPAAAVGSAGAGGEGAPGSGAASVQGDGGGTVGVPRDVSVSGLFAPQPKGGKGRGRGAEDDAGVPLLAAGGGDDA